MLNVAIMLLVASPAPARPETLPARTRAEAYYHFSLAQQARISGANDEALAEYRKAAKLDPTSAEIRAEVARLLRETGKFVEAAAEAREAVRLDRNSPEAHRVLAQVFQMQGDAESKDETLRKATAEWEEVLRLQPGDPQSLLTLAALYERLQQPKDAARIWQLYLVLDPASFDAYLKLGSLYLTQGDSERAAAALNKAVELQPSVKAYQSLGDVYAQAQQAEQAILNYRKALELAPRDVRLRLSLGEVLFRSRRYKEALSEAAAVLASDAKSRFALDLKARSHREQKEFAEATEAADRLLGLDPKDLKAAYLKVTVAEARRDYAEAAAGLESILRRDRSGEDGKEAGNNDRVFLVHLGYAYQQLARYADAAEAFGRARAVGGDPDADLLGYRVEALILAKDLDRGLAEAKAGRARFPEDANLATLEATILREKGDTRGALTIVDAIRQKAPKDVNVLAEVADFYQKAKRYADAETVLKQAREIDPRNLRALFLLGATLERQKRHEDADVVFRDALLAQPDSAPILNYLGYMNADRGVRLEESLGLIEKALKLDPENGAYLDSQGWALYRLNRLGEAEESLRKALLKNGANAVILDHLGDTLKRRGAIQEAVGYWKKALEGEDEGEELDRAAVERKIQEAQSALDAQRR